MVGIVRAVEPPVVEEAGLQLAATAIAMPVKASKTIVVIFFVIWVLSMVWFLICFIFLLVLIGGKSIFNKNLFLQTRQKAWSGTL